MDNDHAACAQELMMLLLAVMGSPLAPSHISMKFADATGLSETVLLGLMVLTDPNSNVHEYYHVGYFPPLPGDAVADSLKALLPISSTTAALGQSLLRLVMGELDATAAAMFGGEIAQQTAMALLKAVTPVPC